MKKYFAMLAMAAMLTAPSPAFAGAAGGPSSTTTSTTSTSTSTSTEQANVGNVVVGTTRINSASGCFGTASFSGSRISHQSDLELLLYGASTFTTTGEWDKANRFNDQDLMDALGHGDVYYNNDARTTTSTQFDRNLDATRYLRTDTIVTQQVTTEDIMAGDVVLATNTNTNTNTDTQTVYQHLTGTGVVNVYQINSTYRYSPIVLDLSGSGRIDASEGSWMPHAGVKGKRLVFFDLLGHGNPVLTEWVGPKAGLLMEARADGSIDGTCLFGNAGGYSNGFEKLSLRDANKDGRLTANELKGLSVWVDANADGRVDASENKTLKSLGITEIGVTQHGMRSTFVMNGKSEMMWDWWPTALDVRKVAVIKR